MNTHRGIVQIDLNQEVLFATTEARCFADNLAECLNKRIWREGQSLNHPPSQMPMRVVRFENAGWSAAYPVDPVAGKLKKFFSIHGLLDYSLGSTWDIVHLHLSKFSGIYLLREFRMGYALRESVVSPDSNFRHLDSRFERSDLVTEGQLCERAIELGLVYGNPDGGSRTAEGHIYPYSEIEPLCESVAEHFLLV